MADLRKEAKSSLRRLAAPGMVLTVMAMAAPAWAQPASDAGALASGAQTPASTEQQDEAAVLAARSDSRNGILAIGSHLDALQTVLDHAPSTQPKMEERDGKLFYRAIFPTEVAAYAAWSQAQRKAAGLPAQEIVELPYTYPLAAFLVGTYYNETRQPEKALKALRRGLDLAPDDSILVTETGVSLQQLRRFDEALALFNHELGYTGFLRADDRARVFRAKGFALTELGRLDEAEQAYRDSLQLEPDHLGAKHELEYIANLRAGHPPTAMTWPTGAQAKKGELPQPK